MVRANLPPAVLPQYQPPQMLLVPSLTLSREEELRALPDGVFWARDGVAHHTGMREDLEVVTALRCTIESESQDRVLCPH